MAEIDIDKYISLTKKARKVAVDDFDILTNGDKVAILIDKKYFPSPPELIPGFIPSVFHCVLLKTHGYMGVQFWPKEKPTNITIPFCFPKFGVGDNLRRNNDDTDDYVDYVSTIDTILLAQESMCKGSVMLMSKQLFNIVSGSKGKKDMAESILQQEAFGEITGTDDVDLSPILLGGFFNARQTIADIVSQVKADPCAPSCKDCQKILKDFG